MPTSVKDLLKQDLPPTNADAQMRKAHTLGSVQHNLKHDDDHVKGTETALKKLYTVDSAKAKSEARRVIRQYQADVKCIEALIRRWK